MSSLIIKPTEVLQALPSLEHDPDLHSLIASAEARILKHLGRSRILSGSVSHGFEGDGSHSAWLPAWPVDPDVDFTATRDGTALSSGAIAGLQVRDQRRLHNPCRWDDGSWFHLTYAVKQDKAPADLKRAAILIVLGLAAIGGKFDGETEDGAAIGDVKREKIRNEETEYFTSMRSKVAQDMAKDAQSGLGAIVRGLLDPHRRLDF